MLVGIYLEIPPYEIWAPCHLNFMKNDQYLFLMCGCSQIAVTQLLTHECEGAPFVHQYLSKTSSRGITFQEKVLVKLALLILE